MPRRGRGMGPRLGCLLVVGAVLGKSPTLSRVKPLASSGCPSVYIYDLPEYWDLPVKLSKLSTLKAESAVGQRCDRAKLSRGRRLWGRTHDDGAARYPLGDPRRNRKQAAGAKYTSEFSTDQYDMPLLLLWRLVRSEVCRRVEDPADADLFVVPTWPAPKGYHDWLSVCNSTGGGLAARLAHLDNRTAHRHVFLVGKGHLTPKGPACDDWWEKPEGLLRSAQRFAYSPDYVEVDEASHSHRSYGPALLDDDATADAIAGAARSEAFPNLVGVPYPSNVHAGRKDDHVPWRKRGTRARLALYLGAPRLSLGKRSDGTPSYSAARHLIAAQCLEAKDADCEVVDPQTVASHHHNHAHFCGLEETTYASTFCFEPGGDSPYRKGFYDALLTGCIPVVFGVYAARAAPWFVDRDALVVLNETAYLDGAFNAVDALRAIPAAEIDRKRKVIAATAHRAMYARDDLRGDAVETLLTGALAAARRREAG